MRFAQVTSLGSTCHVRGALPVTVRCRGNVRERGQPERPPRRPTLIGGERCVMMRCRHQITAS